MSQGNVVDLRGRSLQQITREDIPKDTETLIVSDNLIESLPPDIFAKAVQIWRFDFRGNRLRDLKCLIDFIIQTVRDHTTDCLIACYKILIRHPLGKFQMRFIEHRFFIQ